MSVSSMLWCCGVVVVVLILHDVDAQLVANIAVSRSQLVEAQNNSIIYHRDITPLALPEYHLTTDTTYQQTARYISFLDNNNIHAIASDVIPSLQLAAEELRLPYVVTSSHDHDQHHQNQLFHVLPTSLDLARVTLDIITEYRLRNVAVIYDDVLNKEAIQYLISDMSLNIRLWRINATSKLAKLKQIRSTLVDIRDQEISNFVALTDERTTLQTIKYAAVLGILASPNNWIILDLGHNDLAADSIETLKTNITSIILFSKASAASSSYSVNVTSLLTSSHSYILRSYLLADALHVLAVAWQATVAQHPRPTGAQYTEAMENIQMNDAISGSMRFNDRRARRNIEFDLVQPGHPNDTAIGTWRSDPGDDSTNLLMFPLQEDHRTNIKTLKGQTVKVVSILERPFTMLTEDHANKKGNARFEGFAVDIIKEVSRKLGFQYELYIVADGQFGKQLDNGEWNGIMGDVASGKASMCVAPLSINSDREAAIDFTKPFKTRAINLLMKTPDVQSWYFQFLSPLSSGVWVAILVAMIVAAMILYFIEKYSALCRPHLERFDPGESMWFVFGSLVQGGTDVPVTTPGRLLASAWWFFSMILISSYTANLAAFLTVQQIYPPISQVTELADQTKIKYGTVRDSGVASFFQRTQIPPFAKMWTQMSEIEEHAMVNTTMEGLRRVKEGDYAFLWDNTVTSYMASIDCEYTEIGPSFDTKGFGIGVAAGSIYLDDLSMTVLELEDSGVISHLEDKWWGYSNNCDLENDNNGDTTELHLTHVAGIFFVLIGGVVLSICVCMLEKLYRKARPKVKHKHTASSTNAPVRDVNGAYHL